MAVSSKKIREYRNKYRDKEIKLSAEINTFLNIRSVVNITIDSYSTFGIIYSISMDSIKIIFDENDILSVLAKNKNFCSIRINKDLDFKDSSDFFPDFTGNLLSIFTLILIKIKNTSC